MVCAFPTYGGDDGAGEEEGLSEGPGGDGAVVEDLHAAVVGRHDVAHEELQIVVCIVSKL